jgi:hypothetical protein
MPIASGALGGDGSLSSGSLHTLSVGFDIPLWQMLPEVFQQQSVPV